jgi:hypothetical protein
MFIEEFSKPVFFSEFTHVPPVVTAMELVTRTALWEFRSAFIFCVDRFVGLTECDIWTALCVVILFRRGLD